MGFPEGKDPVRPELGLEGSDRAGWWGEGREAKVGNKNVKRDLKQKRGSHSWLERTGRKEFVSPSGKWKEKVPWILLTLTPSCRKPQLKLVSTVASELLDHDLQ